MASWWMRSSRIGSLAAFFSLRCQNATHRCAPDAETPGDFGFGDTGAVQFPDLGGMQSCRHRSAQSLTVLPGVSQASPSSFAQDFPFELGEDRQQAGHRATRRSSKIERLSQRDEPDTEMLQLLKCRQQICYGATPT